MKRKLKKVIIFILKKVGLYSFARRILLSHSEKIEASIIRTFIQHYIIETGKLRVAICTFGKNGRLMKKILNQEYGIYEELIIDNNYIKRHCKAIRSSELKKKDCSGLFFLLTSEDKKIRDSLLKDLYKVAAQGQCKYIYDPLVFCAPERLSFFIEIYNLIKISDIANINSYVRVGRNNDGGYTMLNAFSAEQIAYSFGIADDVSWDKEITKYGIEVFMYDPTIDRLPEENDKFHFFMIGIAGTDREEQRLLSMETIMNINGHASNENLLLKMDVEGAEWDFLSCTSSETLSHFAQIVIEFHSMTDLQNRDAIVTSLKKLGKTHQAVWIHGNNTDFAQQAGNVLMPNTLELTYVRRKDYNFCECKRCFPMDLDMPNTPLKEDFVLTNW